MLLSHSIGFVQDKEANFREVSQMLMFAARQLKKKQKKTRENSSRDWLGAFSKKIQQVWQASD
jgi:hypothetical protein